MSNDGGKKTDMDEGDHQAPVLDERQQQALAIEWFLAMWREATERGVTPEKMAIVSLSGTLNHLVALYGEEKAANLIAQLPERILAGHFSSGPNEGSH